MAEPRLVAKTLLWHRRLRLELLPSLLRLVVHVLILAGELLRVWMRVQLVLLGMRLLRLLRLRRLLLQLLLLLLLEQYLDAGVVLILLRRKLLLLVP